MALQGRHLDAAETLEQAFREANTRHRLAMSGLYYRAAQVKRLRGDSAGAQEHLTRACQIDPEGQYGQLAARALRETAQGGS
jgi:tetratricopeptide (TPR) repeat protein